MVCDNTKRVVVIRNITSNFIEEAILVLKSKPDENGGRKVKKVFPKDRERMNEHILKEAEEIINNYIKRYGSQGDCGTELRLKPYRMKVRLSNTVINLALLASIALLIFVVARFF